MCECESVSVNVRVVCVRALAMYSTRENRARKMSPPIPSTPDGRVGISPSSHILYIHAHVPHAHLVGWDARKSRSCSSHGSSR